MPLGITWNHPDLKASSLVLWHLPWKREASSLIQLSLLSLKYISSYFPREKQNAFTPRSSHCCRSQNGRLDHSFFLQSAETCEGFLLTPSLAPFPYFQPCTLSCAGIFSFVLTNRRNTLLKFISLITRFELLLRSGSEDHC